MPSLIERMKNAANENERLVEIAKRRAEGELRAMEDKIYKSTQDYNVQLSKTGSDYSLSTLYVMKKNHNALVKQYKGMEKLFEKEFSGAPEMKIEVIE